VLSNPLQTRIAVASPLAGSGGFAFPNVKRPPINPREQDMKVLLISNDAGGYAHNVEAPENTTVQQMFERHIGPFKADSFLIRVNRQPATANQQLREGDRVSFTPLKIEGAI
jgi:hypothetical protein